MQFAELDKLVYLSGHHVVIVESLRKLLLKIHKLFITVDSRHNTLF
jgi:hypothetical protein